MKKKLILFCIMFSHFILGQALKDSIKTTDFKELNLSELSATALESYKKLINTRKLKSFDKANITGVLYQEGKDSIIFTGEIQPSFLIHHIKLQDVIQPDSIEEKKLKKAINSILKVQKDLYKAFSTEWFYTKNYCTQLDEFTWKFSMINKDVKKKYNVESNVNFWVNLNKNGRISSINSAEKFNSDIIQKLSFSFLSKDEESLSKQLNANIYLDTNVNNKLNLQIDFQ